MQVKTALNYIAFEKENSIIYSWNHTDSHAVNKSVIKGIYKPKPVLV